MKKYKNALFMVTGAFLIAFTVNTILIPNKIVAGGVTGLSVVIDELTGFSPSTFVFLVNCVLLLLMIFLVGYKSAAKTIISGNILLPLFMAIIPAVQLTQDMLLAAIIAGALTGTAAYTMFMSGSSTGGTAAIALMINKRTSLKFSSAIAICDIVIVGIGLLVFGVEATLYAVITVVVMQLVVNYLETGLKKSKVVYIISDKHEEIKKDILSNVYRGMTILNGEGAYTGKEKKILMCVVAIQQLKQVEEVVNELDPDAFFFVTSASSAHGEGFLTVAN